MVKKIVIQEPTERSRLESWMALHRVRKGVVARSIGASRQRFDQLMNGIYLTDEWKSRMIEAGIPENLLPLSRPR